MKNIETSFRHLRLFGIVYLCVCTLLVGFSVWKAYSFAEAQREKIYVLDEGKSLMLALSQDLEQNRPVEAREHVRRFHELFFTLSPDKARIQVLMLQRDIEQLSDPDFIPDSSNGVYITFLIIGIIGYFTIPTVSNWIVQAGGGAGNYGKNVNQAASKTGSVVAGTAGAAVGNIAGRLIK